MKKSAGLGMVELMITFAIAGIALVPLIGIIAEISSENTLSIEELLAVHQADTAFQFICCLPFDSIRSGEYYIERDKATKIVDFSKDGQDNLDDLFRKAISDSEFFMRICIEKKIKKAVFTITLDSKQNPKLKRPVSLKGVVFDQLDFFERVAP